ncbi:MAG: TSUP family transporter, partial [Candidatus Acidiferrales bacterium]
MNFIVGFVIALGVGLTGVGGGSFTVPALILLGGLPGNAAVGTAFVFAGVLRLIAAPFYVLGRNVHKGYLRLLLQGAIPGLFIGTMVLQFLSKKSSPVVVIILGIVLAASSAVSFIKRMQNR